MTRFVIRAWIPSLAALWATGCCLVWPSRLVSEFVMDPDRTCRELVSSLGLGELPDVSTPGELGLTYETFEVRNRLGNTLMGWYLPAQRDGVVEDAPLGTVLVMHGTSGTRACTLPWVLLGVANRMNVVTFDYQGYADSGGVTDLGSLYDDSRTVLDWIVADPSAARQRVHLFGTSLGTGPALALASLDARSQIKTVIVEGSYDPLAMLERAGEYVDAPALMLLEVSGRAQFAWMFQMREALPDMSVPVMFIHSDLDQTTPLPGAETLFALARSEAKSFWTFEDMTHMQPLFRAPDRYTSLVVSFWRDPQSHPDPNATTNDETIRRPEFTP